MTYLLGSILCARICCYVFFVILLSTSKQHAEVMCCKWHIAYHGNMIFNNDLGEGGGERNGNP